MMTITTRPLLPTDAATLDTFLEPHTAEAYFLRSNAKTAGLTYSGKFLEAEYFGAFDGDRLVGVISYSWINTILVYAEDPSCLAPLVQAVRPSILKRGGTVEAILGLPVHVDAIIEELGIPSSAFRRKENDGLFRLPLADMRLPELTNGLHVRMADMNDLDLLVSWRVDFNIEAVHAKPGQELEDKARAEMNERIPAGELFILEKDGQPVSFSGAHGHVPDTVMVGPVWTPPELRNRKYGRIATGHALKLLAEKRSALRQAILFASRADAIRVYESLGFIRFSDWRLALVKEDYRAEAAQ
jgi:hypothetical protein